MWLITTGQSSFLWNEPCMVQQSLKPFLTYQFVQFSLISAENETIRNMNMRPRKWTMQTVHMQTALWITSLLCSTQTYTNTHNSLQWVVLLWPETGTSFLFCHFAFQHRHMEMKQTIAFIYQLLVSHKCESWNNFFQKQCAMVHTWIWNLQTQNYEEG